MNRTLHAAIATGVVVLAHVGCNSILDNQPGLLTESGEAGVSPAPGSKPTTGLLDSGASSVPAEADDGGASTVDAGPPPCPTGQQRCAGSCVSSTDPLHGCGDPTCAPCPTAHSSAACQGRTCVVAKCDPGYADCNGKASDGCESDLSKPATCGACNGACGAAAPLCAPSGTTFQCTNGCAPTAPVKCGAECVDLMTSTNHCGNCDIACPDVANAISACAGGVCNVTCKPTFHACAGKCASDADATACGAACTVCPIPAGGSAACVAGACQATCPAGDHLCGGKCAADTDATACGAACTVCPVPPGGTASCVAGACRSSCPAGTHMCAGACVADTDVNACGAACTVCPVPPGGTASCVAGACKSTCNAGTHLCAGACVADTSVAACGAACTVCPVPANATAACTAGACAFTCTAGFGNCDANAANGCEATLASDPLNCGTCGIACAAGQLCVGGACL